MQVLKAKRGPGIPPGLLDGVIGVQWNAPGDHAAVLPPPPGAKHATGEIVEILGDKHFVLVDVAGYVRRVDGEGINHDYIVLPGYWILQNPAPDGTIWALSPELVAAWFDEVK